jgi:hypothetical protein
MLDSVGAVASRVGFERGAITHAHQRGVDVSREFSRSAEALLPTHECGAPITAV